jgi:murein endopeptidase
MRRLTFVSPKGKTTNLIYRKQARSNGATNRGRLENGRCIPASGLGFVHFGPNSCGTDELVTILMFAVAEVTKEYPGTAPVVIGSLSRQGGGRLRPHKSHRTGRDVDIGFYARNNREIASFEALAPDQIDFEKTMFLIVNLLASGRVQTIFVNYSLQGRMYDAAKEAGYDEAQLAWMFDYPRGRSSKSGVIRHARGHMRHFHVRFACPDGDACGD